MERAVSIVNKESAICRSGNSVYFTYLKKGRNERRQTKLSIYKINHFAINEYIFMLIYTIICTYTFISVYIHLYFLHIHIFICIYIKLLIVFDLEEGISISKATGKEILIVFIFLCLLK